MRKLLVAGTCAGVFAFAACDDGRQDRIPGAQPGAVVPEADTVWADTLHPPVPPAPGVEDPGTVDPNTPTSSAGGAVPPPAVPPRP